MKACRWIVVGVMLQLAPAWASAGEVLGAGASFPSKVYEKWSRSYERSVSDKVVYRATGSGDGVKQATARTVMFGGTDSPLPPDELTKRKLVQLPTLVGGIVPVVNLPGIGENRLQLSGELLADLMAGKVQRWNDARVAELNPGLPLPALKVRRVVRADKSGTTEGFTRYLALVSAAFKAEVGSGQQPSWPGEVLADEGNDGVAKRVKSTEGAIGYVSFDRVLRDGLASVKLRNAAGNWVAPAESTFRAAILESDLHRRGDDQATLLDRPGFDSWPITMTSFVLVDAEPARAADATATLRFLYWAFLRGDDLTRGTGFAPLPVAIQSKLAGRLASIKPRDGKSAAYIQF